MHSWRNFLVWLPSVPSVYLCKIYTVHFFSRHVSLIPSWYRFVNLTGIICGFRNKSVAVATGNSSHKHTYIRLRENLQKLNEFHALNCIWFVHLLETTAAVDINTRRPQMYIQRYSHWFWLHLNNGYYLYRGINNCFCKERNISRLLTT